jgi:hypothetical protein
MRRSFGFVIVLSIVLLVLTVVTACSHSATGVASPSVASSSKSINEHAAMSTTTSTAVQVVHVTVTDQQVTADMATFSVGQPYRFVVINNGRASYQVLLAPMGVDYVHMSQTQRQHAALYTSKQVAPGQTIAFEYTFAASAAGQRLGFGSYQQGSGEGNGMWYAFSVQTHP